MHAGPEAAAAAAAAGIHRNSLNSIPGGHTVYTVSAAPSRAVSRCGSQQDPGTDQLPHHHTCVADAAAPALHIQPHHGQEWGQQGGVEGSDMALALNGAAEGECEQGCEEGEGDGGGWDERMHAVVQQLAQGHMPEDMGEEEMQLLLLAIENAQVGRQPLVQEGEPDGSDDGSGCGGGGGGGYEEANTGEKGWGVE
eukprot:scaffold88401_cov19-Tisochrysis_lutea.AAC.1